MQDKPDLTALIASRICHDLISPIGAIGNGVELMTMESDAASRPELVLIADSVANANARIRFFRISFGAARGDQRVARSEVLSILTDLGRAGRVTHGWTSQSDLSRREVRLLFLLLQCLDSALAYGGKVEVTQQDTSWTIRAEGPRLRVDPGLWGLLSTPPATVDIDAGQVHFALVADELARQERRLTIKISETVIQISL